MAKATPAIINLLFISKLKIIQLKSHSISIIRNEHKIWIEIVSPQKFTHGDKFFVKKVILLDHFFLVKLQN